MQFEKSALPIRSWGAGANAGRQSVSAEIEAKSGQHLKPWLLAQGDQPRKPRAEKCASKSAFSGLLGQQLNNDPGKHTTDVGDGR